MLCLRRWLRFGKVSKPIKWNSFSTHLILHHQLPIFFHSQKSELTFSFWNTLQIRILICAYPPFRSISSQRISILLFMIFWCKHDFPCEFASPVASELGRVNNPKIVKLMLSFLNQADFRMPSCMQKILTYRPRFLCCSLEHNIKPKIKRWFFFQWHYQDNINLPEHPAVEFEQQHYTWYWQLEYEENCGV